MRLAIQAWRRGHLKVTGAIIDEAIRRGHQVTLVHYEDDKPGERVTALELSHRWPGAEFSDGLPCDAVIGDPSVADVANAARYQTYALDFVWEQRMRARKEGVTRCWATELHRGLFGQPDEPVSGMTALDALPLVDPDAVRARYVLGRRPVVLLMAAKFGGIRNLWRRTVFCHWYYPELLGAIVRYCRRRGALLVVKTREKNRDPWHLTRVADRIVMDDDLWPYTSAQLVQVADLVIHFQSGAVFEAAAAGVPQLSIRLPQPHLERFPGHDVCYSREPYSLQHWPGVVQSAGVQEAIGLLTVDRVMEKVDRTARLAYAERYMGPLDGRSAARVLDLVEARCRG